MPAFEPNTQKLLYYDPDQSRSTVTTFTEEIKSAEGESVFTIFLLAEIRTDEHTENQYFLRELQNAFSRFFRSQNTRLTESTFEEGLHQLNKILPTFFANRPPSFIESLTFVAGALSGNVMHFSQVGPATIFFVQQDSIYEIGDHTFPRNKNPLKLFREVASGKIELSDIVFISTTNFLDYFSQEKIKRILEEHAQDVLAKGFDEYLLQAPLTTSFAALSITMKEGKLKTIKDLDTAQQQTTSTPYSRSMETLIEREQNTEDILSPKFWPFIKRKTQISILKIRAAIRKYFLKKPSRISPIITENEEAEVPLRYSHKGTKKSIFRARGFITKGWNKITQSISQATKKSKLQAKSFASGLSRHAKEGQIELAPAVRSTDTQRKTNLLGWFQALSQKRKVLFIAAFLLVAIFSQSIVVNGVRKQQAKKKAVEQTLQTQIRQAMDDINASLLYGDDNRIRAAINQLQQELASLQATKGNDDLIAQTQQAISLGEQRLQKIRLIDSPKILSDISNLIPTGKITQATVIGNTFILLNASAQSLVATDIISGISEVNDAVTAESQTPFLLASVSPVAYILNQELSLSKYTPATDSLSPVSFTPPLDSANLSAAASYSSRLYFIDINTNQILKSLPSNGGYSRPTAWLLGQKDLSLANSLAIDGSIYVGFQNGTIQKYTQGEEATFALQEISPALQHINALWTDETTSTLYVLDSDGSRVLMINKNNGNLLQQLVITNIGKIDSFGISEANQTILFVSGTDVYSVPMTEN